MQPLGSTYNSVHFSMISSEVQTKHHGANVTFYISTTSQHDNEALTAEPHWSCYGGM